MAQNAAVGRRADGSPASRAPASRPLATSSEAVVITVRSSARPAGRGPRRARALEPVADLAERHRAADEGDPLVAAVDEVLDREPAAEHVVHRDRAERRVVAGAVDDHHRGAAPPDLVEQRRLRVDRGDQDALDPLLLEQLQVLLLALRALAAVAEHQGEVGGLGGVLDALGDVGEERVAGVEHHVGERAAGARRAAGGPTRCARSRGRPSPARPARGSPALTRSGRLSTLETVPSETPAARGDVLDRGAATGRPRAPPSRARRALKRCRAARLAHFLSRSTLAHDVTAVTYGPCQ